MFGLRKASTLESIQLFFPRISFGDVFYLSWSEQNGSSDMPCENYGHLKYMRDMEMSTWARYSYQENEHLRGAVSDRKAA
jgi:hypothetical protein